MFGHLMNKDINFIKVSANLALILVSCLKKVVFFLRLFLISSLISNTVYYISHRIIRRRVSRISFKLKNQVGPFVLV